MQHLPLAGYRFLDFCWLIAGPLTTRLLADLGAEVIKVESLSRVDRIRETGVQPPDILSLNTNAVFNDGNTNKKSVTINLGTPRGIEVIKDLVRCSDVVSANFTPDRLDRWGLSYDELRRIRPDIIVVNMPVMGKTGPRKDWGSYGNGIMAMSGVSGLTGFADRPPVGLGTLHSDFTTPYFGALQIMAALHQRELTGEGQYLELAQYEAALHLHDTELLEYLVNGDEPERRGNRSREYVPHGVFPCRGDDRWVAIAVRDDAEWPRLCAAMDRADLAARPDLRDEAGRRAAEDEIEAAIQQWTLIEDAWTIAHRLQSLGVPASPVEDVADLAEHDPGMRGHFVTFAHPEGVDILVQQEPLLWNGERLPLALAPLMGEHNEEVFQNLLGHSQEEVVEFVVEQVIY
ncbi:MAG: CaiB/BaiF CoA transferase family protein [Dehalococcoidia bacterium]